MVVLGVKVSVGDRVRYDVENELSDMVTVVGVAVGTGDIETPELLELSAVEDDFSKDDDTDEVSKLWLLEISLLLEDIPDSEVVVSELMVKDVPADDVDSSLIEDPSEDDLLVYDDVLSVTEDPIDDDDIVIGVVVGIDGSDGDDVDLSVSLIVGSDEVLTGFRLPVTGSTRESVTLSVEDVEDVSLLPLVTDELSVFDDENLVDVGSADVSVMPVFVLKLGDDEIVTYDVENELLTVLVAVVGVAVGMDDKTEEEELVVSLSPPFAPPPPSTFFLVVDDDTDDDLSREDDNDELSSLDVVLVLLNVGSAVLSGLPVSTGEERGVFQLLTRISVKLVDDKTLNIPDDSDNLGV